MNNLNVLKYSFGRVIISLILGLSLKKLGKICRQRGGVQHAVMPRKIVGHGILGFFK